MTETNQDKELGMLEKIAAGTSGAVIVAFVVFWAFQVRSVIELLQLAYG